MPFHPFQKLCVTQHAIGRRRRLFAATGHNLITLDLDTGRLVSRYPPTEGFNDGSDDYYDAELLSSPAKKRKLDNGVPNAVSRQESEESIEIVAERQKGERRRPKPPPDDKLPNISHLVVASDGLHIITASVEDKSINVFSATPSDRLRLASTRSMPKRLCSITLTPDEQTLVAADKFGDVYAVPLVPTADRDPSKSQTTQKGNFEPSASEFTVHTKGNLEALRQQRQQKKANERKEGLAFQHRLLLGHVSLLTDVVIAQSIVGSKTHNFVLTADRDEHIRVSRYPQSHIINGFCLGHREFISKLCILPWNRDILISGGGEPSIKTWDWRATQLLHEEPFSVLSLQRGSVSMDDSSQQHASRQSAVSGIWPVSFTDSAGGVVIVALEGTPGFFTCEIEVNGRITSVVTTSTPGNVLDVAVDTEVTRIFVSLDTFHVPGSTKEVLPSSQDVQPFQVFEFRQEAGGVVPGHREQPMWVEQDSTVFNSTGSSEMQTMAEAEANVAEGSDQKKRGGARQTLSEFLYGLENLRKRRGFASAEDDDPAEAEVEAEETPENQ